MALIDVSITGTTTVTSSGYGKMHICSGTSSNYAVTLPTAVSAPAGTLIGFRMDAGLTKLVTLTSSTGTQLDGTATRVMWANESCIFESDTVQWRKVTGRPVPMACTLFLSAVQSVPSITSTVISLDSIAADPTGAMADTSVNVIYCRRPGTYLLSGMVPWLNMAGNTPRCLTQLWRNAAQINEAEQFGVTGSCPTSFCQSTLTDWVAGDYAQLSAYQNGGVNNDVNGAATLAGGGAQLSLLEVVSW